MKKVKITLTRSIIGKQKRQKDTVRALGLRRINQSVEKNATPQIMGMIQKVKHLIQFEEIK